MEVMEDRYSIEEQLAYREQAPLSPVCLTLCGLLIVVLGILPVAPMNLIRILRPAFILACVLFPSRYEYRLTFERWQLVSLIYYTIIFICHEITRNAIYVYVSLVLFILFFIFVVKRVWSKKEILLLLFTMVLACDFQAVAVLASNPRLLGENGSDLISYMGVLTNRNPIAFAIVPGALCSLLIITGSRKALRGPGRLFLVVSFLISGFTVFAIGCRSAFASLIVGTVMLFLNAINEERWVDQRFKKMLLISLLVLSAFFLTRYLAFGTYSERLFDTFELDSGRDRIWRTAIEMIREKPVFGGGYDYWISGDIDMGTHNTFLLTGLYTGYIGIGFLAIFLIRTLGECIRHRAWFSLAFLAETIFHSYSETSLDYYAYIPLIIAVVLLRYTSIHKGNLGSLFFTDRRSRAMYKNDREMDI